MYLYFMTKSEQTPTHKKIGRSLGCFMFTNQHLGADSADSPLKGGFRPRLGGAGANPLRGVSLSYCFLSVDKRQQ